MTPLFSIFNSMSKQSEAKIRQDYTPKLIPQVCSNCANYKCDSTKHEHAFGSYVKVSNQRCGIGGFAVKKTGSCAEWSGISEENAKHTHPQTNED